MGWEEASGRGRLATVPAEPPASRPPAPGRPGPTRRPAASPQTAGWSQRTRCMCMGSAHLMLSGQEVTMKHRVAASASRGCRMAPASHSQQQRTGSSAQSHARCPSSAPARAWQPAIQAVCAMQCHAAPQPATAGGRCDAAQRGLSPQRQHARSHLLQRWLELAAGGDLVGHPHSTPHSMHHLRPDVIAAQASEGGQ